LSGGKLEPYRELVVGERVRIKSGTLRGLEGTLIRKNNQLRFVLSVDLINQQLQAQGISGVSAVLDATTNGAISLQGASTFTASIGAGGTGAMAGYQTAAAGGDPNAAINAITQAVQSLGTTQGIVGAGENKLNYAIDLAQSQITSFSAAQSSIRDANVAQEAANLTQAQVLVQASIAAMAQANQEPQAILSLLKG